MAIVHWDPARELSLLQGDMNRLFERYFSPSSDATKQRWMPAIDIAEEGEHYVLRADLPGMTERDVAIEVQDRTLTISGERRFERKPEHDGGYVRMERGYGAFERSLTLPEGIDASAITANFEHGVLEVVIPKPAEAKPHRVQIGTGAVRAVEAGAGADDAKGKRSLKERVLSSA